MKPAIAMHLAKISLSAMMPSIVVSALAVMLPPGEQKKPTYIGIETEVVEQMALDFENNPYLLNAEIEAKLWDRTRVDALTPTYAIEADWAAKWAEAIGQSLYYADVTGKKPGIILLVGDLKTDAKYIYRCQTVCNKRGIKIWLANAHKKRKKKNEQAKSDGNLRRAE